MKLSERMHTMVHNFLMNIRDESLVPATSTEILKWVEEAVQLEADNTALRKEVEELRVAGARSDDLIWDQTDRSALESGGR